MTFCSKKMQFSVEE